MVPGVRGANAVSPPGSFRQVFHDATRYWEYRRIVYNLALIALVVAWLVLTWPHFQPALTLESALKLFILATLANLCYSAVYLVDIPLERSSIRTTFRRLRWSIWLAGTLFAVFFACYWIADEIYPFVR
jgi:hypothetical protein